MTSVNVRHQVVNPAARLRLKVFIVKPNVAKARVPKALHDIGASPDSLPDKLRLKVFNHQKDRTLIQAEDPWRHPAVQLGSGDVAS
jgi:hypothetical protein